MMMMMMIIIIIIIIMLILLVSAVNKSVPIYFLSLTSSSTLNEK